MFLLYDIFSCNTVYLIYERSKNEKGKRGRMKREEAILELNQLYGIVSSNKQQALDVAISALSVLEEIKAEIEDLDTFFDNDYFSGNNDAMYKIKDVLAIIEKHINRKE